GNGLLLLEGEFAFGKVEHQAMWRTQEEPADLRLTVEMNDDSGMGLVARHAVVVGKQPRFVAGGGKCCRRETDKKTKDEPSEGQQGRSPVNPSHGRLQIPTLRHQQQSPIKAPRQGG